jgi:hypothetical protein
MRKSSFVTLLAALAVGWAVSVSAGAAHAATFSAIGSDPDGSLLGTVTIAPGANSITVDLTNTVTHIRSAGQAISDLSFATSTSFSGAAITGFAGCQLNIPADPSCTPVSSTTRWHLTNTSGTTLTLDAIGGKKPSEMLAGPGPYTDINGGFSNFNPYFQNEIVFTISATGITPMTVISDVEFSFGSGPDAFVPGVPGTTRSLPVPEPGALSLSASAFAAMVAAVRGRCVERKA